MAALARLDGEQADLTPDEIDGHAATCPACREALAGLTTMHAALGRVDYERLDVDLWPALQQRLPYRRPAQMAREGRTILGLTAVLVVWRLAQLLFDVPAPVVNSVIPLALIVIALRRLAGDPFALRVTSHQLQEGKAS